MYFIFERGFTIFSCTTQTCIKQLKARNKESKGVQFTDTKQEACLVLHQAILGVTTNNNNNSLFCNNDKSYMGETNAHLKNMIGTYDNHNENTSSYSSFDNNTSGYNGWTIGSAYATNNNNNNNNNIVPIPNQIILTDQTNEEDMMEFEDPQEEIFYNPPKPDFCLGQAQKAISWSPHPW